MPKKTAHFFPKIDVDEETTVCLVAGGAGFIGAHLCETLLGQNCLIYCLDNFSTGREENIINLKKSPQFQVIEHDLSSRGKLKLPLKVDYVFHVAGVEAYLNGLEKSLETLLVNSFGTKNLLELAQENQAKFVLASTEQVYAGFISEHNLSSYFGPSRTMEAEGAFAEAKRFAEALTFEFLKKYDLNARIVRFDFLYGPKMNLESGSIICKLFEEALDGKVNVPANGLTRLYPTYITDAVYGLVKATFSHTSRGRVYTLVDPHMITLLTLANFLKEGCGQKTEVVFVEGEDLYNFDFPQKSVLDSQELLGWYPKITAKEGVKNTLAWFTRKGKSQYHKEKEVLETAAISPGGKEQEAEIKKEKDNQESENKKKERLEILEKEEAASETGTFPSNIPSFLTPNRKEIETKQPLNGSEPVKTAIDQPEIPQKEDHSFLKRFWSQKALVVIVVFLTVFLVVSPFLALALSSYQGMVALGKTQEAISSGEISAIPGHSQDAKKYFGHSKYLLNKLSPFFSLIGFEEKIHLVDGSLQVGSNLAEATDKLVLALDSGGELLNTTLGNDTGNSVERLQLVHANLDQAIIKLGFAEAEINKLLPLLEVEDRLGLKKQLKKVGKEIPVWRDQLIRGKQTLAILPGILRLYDKQTFLILLQNSQELRPTGGFIGSYALVTIEKGKILDFKVEDIYTADGQLKGYIQPPDAIKRYLGEDIWWFRDSNISPDFPTSAARAAWFLEKEMKREVVGVIGINLEAAKNLLKATGPVYLPDYKESINADNIFERAEYHSEVSFFPGSTQKKDFLGSLANGLFEKLKQINQSSAFNLWRMVTKSLDGKEIMIWLPGQEGKLLAQYGWDGSLRTPPQTLPEFEAIDLTDYLMPVEANFGVNKANFFLSRQSQQEITILKDGEIQEKYILKLANSSPSESWPGGRYKNYFRLYTPSDTQLGTIEIVDPKTKEVKTVQKRDYEIRKELGRQVFGFLIEVPPKEERIVTVTYRRARRLFLEGNKITYLFYWQKQSGIGRNPLTVTINYPLFLKPVKMNQEASLTTQSLKFSSESEGDRLFVVTFSK